MVELVIFKAIRIRHQVVIFQSMSLNDVVVDVGVDVVYHFLVGFDEFVLLIIKLVQCGLLIQDKNKHTQHG